MEIPTLTTTRLTLRGWQDSDADAFARITSDPDFVRYIGDGQPIDADQSWRLMATIVGHWHLRGFGLWLVEETQTGKFVGRVGLWQPSGWPDIEIGWGIAPEFWGKGFASEAANAAMAWAFNELNLESLVSLIHPDNEASKRVALKMGEKFDQKLDILNKTVDVYRISREKYLSHIA